MGRNLENHKKFLPLKRPPLDKKITKKIIEIDTLSQNLFYIIEKIE
jgi:hypothetical protein